MTDRTPTNFKKLAPALAGVLATAAIANAADPTAAELRQQIDAMQAQINKIEAKAASSEQTQKTIENVLGDASRRSQLLQAGGLTAGYDKGFFLGTADGNFKLSPFFQFQFRSVTNYGEDAQTDGDDNLESGFEIRRAKFGIAGNAFSKDLKYQLRWATARSGGDLILENAYITYDFADEFAFRVGQWKDNVFHEETVSSGKQLGVDRSLVNELLGGGQTDYVQGVSLLYGGNDNPFRAEISYVDGANTDNTDYTDGGGGPGIPDIDPSFGVSARAEYKVFGDWKAYDDFSALKNKEDLLVIGAGVNWTQGGDSDVYFHTLDVQYEGSGLPISVYVAYLGQQVETADDEDGYNYGGLAQVGYMLTDNWEVFGRVDYTDIDSADDYTELAAGVNYFFAGHNAKVTVDVIYLPDGSPSSQSGIGVQGGDNDQYAIRGQFQLQL